MRQNGSTPDVVKIITDLGAREKSVQPGQSHKRNNQSNHFPIVSPIPPSLDKDEDYNSDTDNSSSADEEDEAEVARLRGDVAPVQEWHGSHWDLMLRHNSPWGECDDPGTSWWDTCVRERESSISNDRLFQSPSTQKCLQRLSRLRQRDIPSMKRPYPGWPIVSDIPLFQGEEGDEYQLELDFKQRLANVQCPAVVHVPWLESAAPLHQLRCRFPPPDLTAAQQPRLPKFIVALGPLTVRTSRRCPSFRTTKEPVTERTDYLVVVDAESKAMPLWLLCSRIQLRERVEDKAGNNAPQLPLFGGLLHDEDCGYDAACILDSVHRLGAQGPDRPTYEEACELVRRTRAVVDPGVLNSSVSKLEELTGEPLPKDWNDTMKLYGFSVSEATSMKSLEVGGKHEGP